MGADERAVVHKLDNISPTLWKILIMKGSIDICLIVGGDSKPRGATGEKCGMHSFHFKCITQTSGQIWGQRRNSASPRPPCDGTPSSPVRPSPRQTPGPSRPYPSGRIRSSTVEGHFHRLLRNQTDKVFVLLPAEIVEQGGEEITPTV